MYTGALLHIATCKLPRESRQRPEMNLIKYINNNNKVYNKTNRAQIGHHFLLPDHREYQVETSSCVAQPSSPLAPIPFLRPSQVVAVLVALRGTLFRRGRTDGVA